MALLRLSVYNNGANICQRVNAVAGVDVPLGLGVVRVRRPDNGPWHYCVLCVVVVVSTSYLGANKIDLESITGRQGLLWKVQLALTQQSNVLGAIDKRYSDQMRVLQVVWCRDDVVT